MLFRRRMNQFPKRSRRNHRRRRHRRKMFLRLHSHQIRSCHIHCPAIHRQPHPLPIALIPRDMQTRPRTQNRIIRPRRSGPKPRSTKANKKAIPENKFCTLKIFQPSWVSRSVSLDHLDFRALGRAGLQPLKPSLLPIINSHSTHNSESPPPPHPHHSTK